MRHSRRPILAVVAMALVWALLSGANYSSLVIGIPSILLAVWAYTWLSGAVSTNYLPPGQDQQVSAERSHLDHSHLDTVVSLRGFLLFLPFFLGKALSGAIDVAKLALSGRHRFQSGFFFYHSCLMRRDALSFFIFSINLLPGTVAVRRIGQRLELHALNPGKAVEEELAVLEQATARIFPTRPTSVGHGAEHG